MMNENSFGEILPKILLLAVIVDERVLFRSERSTSIVVRRRRGRSPVRFDGEKSMESVMMFGWKMLMNEEDSSFGKERRKRERIDQSMILMQIEECFQNAQIVIKRELNEIRHVVGEEAFPALTMKKFHRVDERQ